MGGLGEGDGLPPPPQAHPAKYPAAMYNSCGILFVSVERWHCVYMGASAATNTTGRQLRQIKIPWQSMGFVRGTAMVDFIYMVALERNGLGWAGLGSISARQ